MHWSVPLLSLSTLLSFTTCFYFFSTPETIAVARETRHAASTQSYWGPVDSDFDWCERNNELSAYLSEPFNTATSAAYPLCAGYAWRLHHRLSLSRWHRLMLSVTMAMGVGSMIFHGTLRYWAQLLDELPLYAMAVLAAATLRQRASRAPGVQPLAAAWSAFIAAGLLLSERDSAARLSFPRPAQISPGPFPKPSCRTCTSPSAA